MVRKRLLQLLLCPGILLQTACDEPASGDSASEQQLPPTELGLQPTSRSVLQTDIPADEPTLRAVIQKAAEEPQHSSSYAEQVKALCFTYLNTYGNDAPGRECALECLVQAMQAAPERFSATDFDMVARYCAAAEGTAYEKKAAALNDALKFYDYRLSAQDHAQLLAAADSKASQALSTGDKETAAYALALLVQQAPTERKEAYLEKYFQEADYTGSPYRLQMLQQAENLPLQQRCTKLAEELKSAPLTAKRADVAAEIIHSFLCSTNGTSADELKPLAEHPHTRCLLLTEQLLLQMHGTSSSEQIHSTALQLQELLTDTTPQRCTLAYAQYLCRFSTAETAHSQATEICRNLIKSGGIHKEEAQFLLAEALLGPGQRTEATIAEAANIYRELATSSSIDTVRQALQALLNLQQEQKQYTEACATAAELQRYTPQRRNELMQLQAELYEKTGNFNTAINIYAQLKMDNMEELSLSAPACLKMMQLLNERNLPQRTDKKNAKYYCSDKWYAWQQGLEFAEYVARNTDTASMPEETRRCLEQINELSKSLGRDYHVQIEERDRPR